MNLRDFATTLSLARTRLRRKRFNAIVNPRGWWLENIQVSTEKLDGEYTYSKI
jgi:hypothetical protein